MLQGSGGEQLANQAKQKKEAALDSLKHIAGTKKPAGVGPIAVGNIKDLDSENILSAIASAYFLAFSGHAKTYPYLVS